MKLHGKKVELQNWGGYPIRLEETFDKEPAIIVVNKAKPGKDCLHSYARFRRVVLKNKSGAKFSDLAIEMCGINGYFSHKDPSLTRIYLQKIRRFGKRQGIMVWIGDLIPVAREFQIPWRNEVNAIIKKMSVIKFSKMPEELLSGDDLHPNASGHQYLFEQVRSKIEKSFGTSEKHFKILKSLKILEDSDLDGVPDKIEKRKYGTNPFSADTDSDGATDLEEALMHSDPLNP